MIRSLQIERFRCFREFTLSNLGQVNLLVGMNNSGKTSILETVHILKSRGTPPSLWSVLTRRGERIAEPAQSRDLELDVSHLFEGHEIDLGTRFQISSDGDQGHEWVSFEIAYARDPQLPFDEARQDAEPSTTQFAIQVRGEPSPLIEVLPLTRRGGLTHYESLDLQRRVSRRVELPPINFIDTELRAAEFLARQWKDIVLTEQEELVNDALRILEPDLERIAFVGDDTGRYGYLSRGGVLAKIRGIKSPIPLGSMGEGMWRMLVLAVSTIRSRGGVLLVDEIDTGLHHTVMADMWRLISETAKRLSVQVFATTHSSDCVKSFARNIRRSTVERDSYTLQRVERSRMHGIPYSAQEILIAADRGAEVR